MHSALHIIQEETASPNSNLDLEDDIFVIVTWTWKKMRLSLTRIVVTLRLCVISKLLKCLNKFSKVLSCCAHAFQSAQVTSSPLKGSSYLRCANFSRKYGM